MLISAELATANMAMNGKILSKGRSQSSGLDDLHERLGQLVVW